MPAHISVGLGARSRTWVDASTDPRAETWCGVIMKPGTSKRGSAFVALAPPRASAAVVVAAIANGSPTSAFMVRSFRRAGHG